MIELLKHPRYQSISILFISLIITLGHLLFSTIGLIDKGEFFPYLSMMACFFFYSIANAAISLQSKNLEKYWGESIMGAIVFVIVSGLLAYLLTGVFIDEAGFYKMILMTLVFVYLVLLCITRAMVTIVNYAQK